MGAIHTKPLSVLADELAAAANLRAFVETGTFEGDSLGWAANTFERVWTIEIDPNYQAKAKAVHGARANISFRLGDSRAELTKVCAELTGPALFWLDAHAGAGFFAPDDNCPLLEELDAVLASPFEHVIFIDDARAFIAPPPPPFNYRKWPTLDEIFAKLAARPNYRSVVMSDALIAAPEQYRELIANYCFAVRPRI